VLNVLNVFLIFHPGRKLEEISLNDSIRYANRDPIERWLNGLLCLDAAISRMPECCLPDACQLFYVNREQLFSYNKVSEAFLQRVMALFVSSHYKVSICTLWAHVSLCLLSLQGKRPQFVGLCSTDG
jgi:tRNA(Met) C34 N-acetyltransferase TmcA